MDDSELLRHYLEERSEKSFAELVRRHLPLVFRAALRQAEGDAAQATEIAQAVFVLLARKARVLLEHRTLAGWLHTTVCYTASSIRRANRRRRWYEQEASRMADLTSDDTPPDWTRVQPVIDEALQGLDARDRDAILLRFFENRPFAEIAARLHLKEDAARMRVNRALARLRERLAERGISSTEAALTALLATEATTASASVPSALAGVIAHGAVAAGQSLSHVSPFLQIMSAKKTLAATAAIAALLAGTGSALVFRGRLQSARSQNATLQTDNDALRDRLTAARLANPKADPEPDLARAVATAPDPETRLQAMHSQVRLREASRDALPTAVAHPLKFRGYDTPVHAVESFIWSSYHSDAGSIARSLYLDDNARAAVETIRSTLTPEVQAQYPTAESLLAMCIAYDAIRHPGPNSEDIFVDAPEPTYSDANNFSLPNGHTYHLTPAGWKFAFPARAVPAFLNTILHPKAPAS
jgi:RNA polymerase sigma factor (sigma-70 family)